MTLLLLRHLGSGKGSRDMVLFVETRDSCYKNSRSGHRVVDK
jgi:hypothetical protein